MKARHHRQHVLCQLRVDYVDEELVVHTRLAVALVDGFTLDAAERHVDIAEPRVDAEHGRHRARLLRCEAPQNHR